eukprot:ANDGO_07795.mRNA.1 Cytoplasmic dynein 2 light intermediate chain 1
MKDLWQLASELPARHGAPSYEVSALLVGPRSGGKSTVVNRFMKKTDEKPRPSLGLDYTYGKKEGAAGGSQTVHFFEIGGGRAMAQLVDVVMTKQRLQEGLVVCVVLDLSSVAEAFSEALYWGTLVRQRAPIVFIANKYDLFANAESEERRIVSRALRFVALHFNGSLIYASQEPTTHSKFRSFLNANFFPTQEGKGSELMQTDHSKLIVVPAGTDNLKEIGVPKPASDRVPPGVTLTKHPDVDKWQLVFFETFPLNAERAAQDSFSDLLKPEFAENIVDAAIERKRAEFERVKEREREKEKEGAKR